MPRRFWTFLLLIFIGFSPFSCQKNCFIKTPEQKTLKIAFCKNPLSIDPRKNRDFVTASLVALLYQGLLKYQPDGSLLPSLAKDYTISNDQLTYTFHLRDCYWSNGKKITAQDFENSWKTVLNPNFGAASPQLFFCIKNAEKVYKNELPLEEVDIQALDEKTLQVVLEYPTPHFLALTAFCVFYPVSSDFDESLAEEKIPTSGPFILEKWKHNHEIVLKKNSLFWNADHIGLNTIHISILQDETTAFSLFEKKELDWIGTPICPIPLDVIPNLQKQQKLTLSPIGGSSFCAFNVNQFPFNNKNMRKAFAYAINRKAIVKNLTQLQETIGTRLIPPILMNQENKNLIPDHARALAKQHFQKALEELHIQPKDCKIVLSFKNTPLFKRQAEILQEQWAKIFNIPIQLQTLEDKIYYHNLETHQFIIALSQWMVQYNDPMNILERFQDKNLAKNYSGWEDPLFQKLFHSILWEKDPAKKQKLIETAEVFLLEEMPVCPIYHYYYVSMCQPYVKNLSVGTLGDVHFENTKILKNE